VHRVCEVGAKADSFVCFYSPEIDLHLRGKYKIEGKARVQELVDLLAINSRSGLNGPPTEVLQLKLVSNYSRHGIA
jgi:hypothetical protein